MDREIYGHCTTSILFDKCGLLQHKAVLLLDDASSLFFYDIHTVIFLQLIHQPTYALNKDTFKNKYQTATCFGTGVSS
jgi:hypothetical protein